MATTCNFKTAEASVKAKLRTDGIIDEELIIQEDKLNAFREQNTKWSRHINNQHGILGRLFNETTVVRKKKRVIKALPNKEMFRRIDAAKGIIYKENEKYRRDFSNNYTLTPYDMVSKYITSDSNGTNVRLTRPATFSKEEVLKLIIGIEETYPTLTAEGIPSKIVNGEQQYTIETKPKVTNPIGVTAGNEPGSFDEIYDTKEKRMVEQVIEPLLKKFKGVEVNWVTQEEMDKIVQKSGKVLMSKEDSPTGYAQGNKIYLVEGKVTASTALEELLHLFTDALMVERKPLYMGLVKKAAEMYPDLVTKIAYQYSDEKGFTKQDRDAELITRALRDAYIQERKERPEGQTTNEFLKLAREFFKWMIDKLKDLYDIVFDQPRADLSNLPLNATLGDIAAYLNVNDVLFTGLETVAPRFSLGKPSEDYDADESFAREAPADPDEKAKYVRDRKIERAKSQVKRLEATIKNIKEKQKRFKTRDYGGIIETLEKLLNNSIDYVNLLENNTETVSVTKFVGSTVFDEKQSKNFQAFQDFGTFLHFFLEEIQLDASKSGLSPLQIVNNNPDYIRSLYEKYKNYEGKDLITLKGVDSKGKLVNSIPVEQLFDDLINIIGIINEPFIRGELVIPEITVYGVDSLNRVVDGRLDYIIIRPDGTVGVNDFKTTRSAGPMNVYSDKVLRKEYYTKALEDGVHPMFQRLSGRSKITSFMSQVGAYSRLLAQMGVESKDDNIISIIYSPNGDLLADEEIWAYEKMHVAKLPLAGEYSLSMEIDEYGNPLPEVSPIYKQITNALRIAIPVEGEVDITDPEKKIIRDREYISTIPREKMDLIINSLKTKIEMQLQQVNDEINRLYKAEADEPAINKAKNRKTLINEAKSWFERTMRVGDELKAIPQEMVLKGTLDKVVELINDYFDSVEKIKLEPDTNKVIGELSERNKQLENLKDFLGVFKKALLDQVDITEENPLINTINNAIDKASKAQGVYIDIAGKQFVKAILSMPKKNVQEMMRQMEMYYEIEIPKLERIIAGDSSIFDKGSFWLGGKIKRVFGAKGSPGRTITQDMKEAAAEKLKRIQYFLSKKEFDEAFVKEYVENTFQNPESGFYIGSTIQQGFGNLTGDDFRASYGNSELAITAMANYAIAMTQQATTNFFDRMEKIKVGSLVRTFANKFGSYAAANEAISKKIKIKDFATGEEVEYMSFRGPISQEYKNKIDEFQFGIHQINEKIEAAKEENLPEDEKKKKLKELRNEKKEQRTKFSEWLVENAETKLVPELYLLEASLPDDIREQIEEMNNEIARIKSDAHDQDWALDDTGLLRIKEIEFKIAQLRKQAILEDSNLIDVFEKMDRYYKWEVNQGKFDYARLQVIKQYGEDSDEYRTWTELNTDSVPDPKWVEDYQNLLDQKKALYEENPELDDLYRRRNELISKYKFRSRFSSKSMFNPYYMSEEDYQALTIIEEEIEDYYAGLATRSFDGLSKAEKDAITARLKEVAAIDAKINSIRSTRNKPEYTMEMNQRINQIKKTLEDIDKETDPTNKATLQAQLLAQDQNFKTWYDRNNTETYRLGTIQKKGKVTASPTRFNVVYIPSDPAQMIRVPNSTYRTRSYTEEAYNPNYNPTLEKQRYSADHYPSPKGVVYNKDTGRFTVDKTARWVDPLYLEMLKDPEVEEFFNKYVMDEYYNKQVGMSAHKLGFLYPGDTQSGFDTLMVDGIEGVKREAREWINNNILLGASEIERADNKYGIAGQMRVRFSHNYKLPASIGTKDGINALMKWGLQYEIYNAMEQANLVISPSIEYLKYYVKPQISDDNPIAQQQIDKVIDILEYERNKFIYGQEFVTPRDVDSSWSSQKLLRQFMTAVSWGRLAFDPAMQIGNLVSGNVQMFLSMQMAEGGNGIWKDWAFAKSQMYGRDGFMYNVIADWGKVDEVSLSTKILRYFNPSMRSFEEVVDLGNRSRMRRLLNRGFNLGDIAYIIQDKGEMEIAMTTLLKNLSAHKFFVYEMNPDGTRKVDDEGNLIFAKDNLGNNITVSAYEALVDTETATPGLRKDVAISMEDLDAIRVRTHQEYLQMQGNYASWTQPKIASSIWGTLLLYYRKYLEPFIENRFKGLGGVGDPKNWAAGQAQIGWWTAFFKMIRTVGTTKALYALLPGAVTEKFSIQDVNPYYKAKAGQLRRELLYATIAMFAYTTLRSFRYGDDDEKKELTWGQMQAMRVLAKVANESRSMVYVPYIGRGDDFVQNFATFTTAFNEGKTLYRMTENLGYYTAYELFDSESAFDNGYYQRRSYRFEAGDPKLLSNIYALSGLDNILDIINPEYSVSKLYQKKG